MGYIDYFSNEPKERYLHSDLFGEKRSKRLELSNVALVERKQEFLDPIVWGVIQRIQYWMHELKDVLSCRIDME